jgi:hypothetical protein
MAKALTERQEIVLGIVREGTVLEDGEALKFYYPSGQNHSQVYDMAVSLLPNSMGTHLRGSDGAIILGFARRGLVTMRPSLSKYACAITESGVGLYDRVALRWKAGIRGGTKF